MTHPRFVRIEFTVGDDVTPINVRDRLASAWRAAVVAAGYQPDGEPRLSVDVDNGEWVVLGAVLPG